MSHITKLVACRIWVSQVIRPLGFGSDCFLVHGCAYQTLLFFDKMDVPTLGALLDCNYLALWSALVDICPLHAGLHLIKLSCKLLPPLAQTWFGDL
jgi:hypothetical protein